MKWTKLKLELLPLIVQEVDQVTEKYMNMINDMVFSESDLFSDYLELRESISQRIEEIDNFYEDNFGEPNIMHFEKARIRLKKLLTFNPDMFEMATNKNEMKSLYLMNRNKIQEKNRNNPRFAPSNFKENLNKNTFRSDDNFMDDDNFQSFYNAKGNNLVGIQEFDYQNNANQGRIGNSKSGSKNNSPIKKQVGFNNSQSTINNINDNYNNYNLFQGNHYSPINAPQNKTPYGYENNNQANFNYNYNVNSINPNSNNNNSYNYTPQNNVFGRLYPQSNRNLNNINASNFDNSNKNVHSASKSPISRNKNELGNNKNTSANQSRVLSAPKLDKSKAAKYRPKEVEYQLYDFVGNKILLDKKNPSIPKKEYGGNKNFFDVDVDHRELMFRLKMSENEYQLFLRERNNAIKKK